MKNFTTKILTIASAVYLSGCAANYKKIQPSQLNYNSTVSNNNVELSYKYDVLRERGNKKYAKKEDKKAVKMVAVKITNNTEVDIIVSRDVKFFAGQSQVFPLEPQSARDLVKQNVLSYLPYALLTFTTLTITKSNSYSYSQERYPIGLGLGPGVTIGNMVTAGNANKKMLSELYENNIMNKVIKKGETAFGIISLRGVDYSPLSIEVISENSPMSVKKEK